MAILDYFYESPGDKARRINKLEDEQRQRDTERNQAANEWKFARERELAAAGVDPGKAALQAQNEYDKILTSQPLANMTTAEVTAAGNRGALPTAFEKGATQNEADIARLHGERQTSLANVVGNYEGRTQELEANKARDALAAARDKARLTTAIPAVTAQDQAAENQAINQKLEAQAQRPDIFPLTRAQNAAQLGQARYQTGLFDTKLGLAPEESAAMRQEVAQRGAIAGYGTTHPGESVQFKPDYGPGLSNIEAAIVNQGLQGTVGAGRGALRPTTAETAVNPARRKPIGVLR